MSTNSKIEWTRHTFNPWWGCVKVSPACDHCYAEKFANYASNAAFGVRVTWGPGGRRAYASEKSWADPVKWNAQARREGVRRRVFCASMADVFEGGSAEAQSRDRLWKMIESTQSLDWLLLTKRPINIMRLIPERWRAQLPGNVWVGTTIENQEWTDRRLPALLEVPAVVRFVSAEPLLGPLDLSKYLHRMSRIDWVILGGESGVSARPTPIEWYRSARDQVVGAQVPLFFKQWGNFRIEGESILKLRKKNDDRRLDGRIWGQVPETELGVIRRRLDPSTGEVLETRWDRLMSGNDVFGDDEAAQ
jgi:protein gp37